LDRHETIVATLDRIETSVLEMDALATTELDNMRGAVMSQHRGDTFAAMGTLAEILTRMKDLRDQLVVLRSALRQ
jgi:hypothetical protein